MRFYQYSILYVILIILFFAQYGFASVQEETAAWVVRWHIDSPAEIHSICSEAKGKYNTLLVQVRGRADAYYSSNLVPRAEELAGQQEEFDPLSTILSQCSENKIQAWINVFYLWTGEIPPESPQHPARVANSWIIKDNNGKSVSEYSPLTQAQGWIEGIYADPSSPDYRVYLLDIVKEIIGKYPIEGIHLDFIRYPGLSYGYDSNLAGQFSDTYGFDPKWLPDSINHHMIAAWLDGSMVLSDRILTTATLLWAIMRSEAVTEMVNGVRQVINNSDKKIILSAAVFPDQLSAYLTKGQDWQQWVYNRSIDELYPMAYFGEKERVYRQLQAVANSINSTEATLWAGLGAYIKDAEEIKEEVEAVLPLHFKGISLFSLGHIQQKKEKTESYFNAITKPFQFKENQDSSTIVNQDFPENFNDPDIINALKLLQHDHPKYPLTNNFLKECVLTRKKEFFDVLGKDILPLITEIQNNINLAPPSLKMRGYLRFVHRYDSEEKRQEQLETSREARKLIISGKNPFTVATQYSQAGGRSFGAPLPIKYISDLDTEGQMLLQLKPGEVSQIFKKADGYWFYQILGKDGVKKQELQDIPWPARRILLRDALARRLSPQQ